MKHPYQAPDLTGNGIAVYSTLGGGSVSLENPPQAGVGGRQDSDTGNDNANDSNARTAGESS
jgi:hypothetical protein